MSDNCTPRTGSHQRQGRHRGSPSRTETSQSRFGATAGRHRAEVVRRTSRRALATVAVALGLTASPAFAATAVADYTVRAGDTLGTIADRHGTTWQALYRRNSDTLSSPHQIYVGQQIDVRGGGAGQHSASGSGGRSTTSSAGSSAGLLAEAAALEGIAYNYGGDSPAEGFDCSGFTSYVFAQTGKTIPRTSGAQAAAADSVSASDLRPGDLVFYHPYGDVSHVAIYAGNGMVWESPGTGDTVQYAPIWDVARSYGRF
ncbi:MAG: NLP/P60 family protein [uncultured Nocardioidaceae bacterium]|uniref:NLP/P60 family protein n=1 Tax=uncultured Nocardioidaceae bacterium TaxID=253824 RepID=A0A6J4LQQ4_9ACTN|nr:MAG: NLP/P60 family protein [uncultured Nocardioidaceae bacterium]